MGSPRYRRNGTYGQRDTARCARSDGSRRTRHHRLSAVAFALLVLLAVAGCGGRKKATPAPPRAADADVDFTVIDSPSLQFLPRHDEAPGWRLEEDPIVVPGDKLSAYLAGGADDFSRYEVVDVTAGKYVAVGAPGFATVEIFRFPDFVKAFGAYSMRKEAARRFLTISNEGYVSKYAVHVWRGPFYIRVTGGAQHPFEALTQLASSVADRMPAAPAKPAVFNFFPTDTRIPNSERYSANDGFGQTFLGNAFLASFNVGGDVIDGLIIPSSNKAMATRILDAYRALYVRNGKLLDPIPNLGEDNFTGEDRYLGRAVAFRIDRFVIAFNGFKERQKLVDLAIATDARILGTIRKELVAAEKQAEQTTTTPQQPTGTQPPWGGRPQAPQQQPR